LQEPQPSIFALYASHWFPAIVDALIGDAPAAGKQTLHYVMLDVCVMLLSWPTLKPFPHSAVDAAAALLSYLVCY
jgi:hypothetical protein